MKYAVGIFDPFSGTNRVTVVESPDEYRAVCEAVINLAASGNKEETRNWLEDMEYTHVEDLLNELSNGDLIVSEPYLIK
jgi:hypothetical protein